MRQLMHAPTATLRERRRRLVPMAALCCSALALAILLTTHASTAHASACSAQNDYTGPANGQWNAEGNWSNKLPKSSETVCIPEGKGTITIAAGVKAEVKTLLAQSAVSVASTASLAIAEHFYMEEPAKDEETASRFTDGLTIASGALVSTAGNWILMSGTVLLEGEIKNTTGNINEVVARLESGTLEGEGTMDIPFGNIGGTVQPGGADHVGAMHFVSHSSQGPNGTLVLDIESQSAFDHFVLNSEFTWFGTLVVNLLGGYEPPVGTDFEFQTGGGTIGEFEHITAGFVEYPKGNDDTIEVAPRAPSVLTGAATGATQASVVLNGTVNPNGLAVNSCGFEYGTTTSYEATAGCGGIAAHSDTPVAVSANATGLKAGTTYHYRLFAKNEVGTNRGEDRTFTTPPASEEKPKEVEKEKPSGGETESKPGGATETKPPLVAEAKPAGGGSVGPAAAEAAIEKVLLGCGTRPLVLNDVLQKAGKVLLIGAAERAQAGKQVKIVFGSGKVVATATVGSNGEFSATAPLPAAKVRNGNGARYVAKLGSLRSLDLKLTRRLVLEPPSVAGGKVTLSGQVAPPLAKPIATVTVSRQVECGTTSVVARVKPSTSGRFEVTLPAPTGAAGAVYRLSSAVAQSRGSRHSFATYSLPLPAVFG